MNTRSRPHLAFAPLIALLILSGIFPRPALGRTAGFLGQSGTQIVDDNGVFVLKGVNLGGWLYIESQVFGGSFANDGFYNAMLDLTGTAATAQALVDAYRANFITADDINLIKSLGFNSVRVPLDYHLFVDDSGNLQTTGFTYLDNLLTWCTAAHIYVILDMHETPGGQADPGTLFSDSAKQALLIKAWVSIASRYAWNPWIGGYDLVNEPVVSAGNGQTLIRNLYSQITTAIRGVDSNHLILAEGNWYATDLSNFGPAWDGDMAYSVHNYWSAPGNGIGAQASLANQDGVALWLGEFGENSNAWYNAQEASALGVGAGWSFWTWKYNGSENTHIAHTSFTPGFQAVQAYWYGYGAKPSQTDAYNDLMGMFQQMGMRYCGYNRDVVDSLLRPDFATNNVPFANNVIPGRINAADYDMGNQGVTYWDTVYEDTVFESGTGQGGGVVEIPWNNGYAYRNDGVDIGWSYDSSNGWGPYVGWIDPGEWQSFTVDCAAGQPAINIRYSGTLAGSMNIQMDGVGITGSVPLPSTSGSWATVTVQANTTISAGSHTMRIVPESGGFNLRYFDFVGEPSLPPTGLSATARSNLIWLQWTGASGAAAYNVKRAAVSGGPYTTIAALPYTSYTDTSATNGSAYYYVITATNSAGESVPSPQIAAAPDPQSISVNCGGSLFGQFVADTAFSGGTASSTSAGIDTGGVASPASQPIYQSYRYGDFTYSFTGLTPGATYSVRMHFAELYWTSAGERLFNVAINGAPALTNFDILAAAGAQNEATVQEYSAAADINGQIAVQFTSVVDNAACNGIEILSQPAVQLSNLALSGSASVSSVENSYLTASAAMDGNLNSRWGSLFSDPQWIETDLGAVFNVSRVVLDWAPAAYGKAYQIQASLDNSAWTTVYSTASGVGGTDDISFSAVNARFVRMVGTQRGTPYGYSLWEFQVYGGSAASPPWVDRDIGSPGYAGYSAFDSASGIRTVVAGGQDIAGMSDQFHFVSQDFSGDGSMVAKVTSAGASDIWAKSGVMFRDPAAADAMYAFVFVTPGAGIGFEYRNAVGNATQVAGYVSGSSPAWVKVARSGASFSGYYSSDGVTWTQIGGAETIPMSATAGAGLAVTAHDESASDTAAFSNISLLTPAWSSADIGNSAPPGGSGFGSSTAGSIAGGGTDIWGTSDQFQFAYQPLTGNGQIYARVTGVQNTDPWAKAGVMIRETAGANSTNAFLCLTASNGINFQWRTVTGGTTTNLGAGAMSAPYWLRLMRMGSGIVASQSADGVTWSKVGSLTISMNSQVDIGLAVTSHNSNALNTSTFDHVLVSGLPPGQAGYAAYQSANFTAAQLANPAISAAGAAANQDGVSNLLKYATGISPWASLIAANGGEPIPRNQNGYLTMSYVRLIPPYDFDIDYTVEVSADMVHWNSGAGYTTDLSVIPLDATREQVTVRDNTPFTVSKYQFMRLRVTY